MDSESLPCGAVRRGFLTSLAACKALQAPGYSFWSFYWNGLFRDVAALESPLHLFSKPSSILLLVTQWRLIGSTTWTLVSCYFGLSWVPYLGQVHLCHGSKENVSHNNIFLNILMHYSNRKIEKMLLKYSQRNKLEYLEMIKSHNCVIWSI